MLACAAARAGRRAYTAAAVGVAGVPRHDAAGRAHDGGGRGAYHASAAGRDTWLPWKPFSESAEEKMSGKTSRFPEWIEKWDRRMFYRLGYGLTAATATSFAVLGVTSAVPYLLAAPVAAYWTIGLGDIKQKRQTVLRNFPVLGHVRYFFESIRPEIQQYFIEQDTSTSGVPFSRSHRSVAYQRAKVMKDTLPFGTRRSVYETGYEWANHSLWPKTVKPECERVTVGGPECVQRYSASLLNISAMSYGALSDNAILALNTAAREGDFYHNTGEGGVSRFHREPGGAIVWNVGTGYFGCRNPDGTFSPERFKDTASDPNIKMIELKLSQGAKPAHGGVLPGAKVTPLIAEARGITMDGSDVVSPPRHSAFQGPRSLLEFVARLRELSGGKPVGFKMCVGRPAEVAAIVKAMTESGIVPDFITVDGSEGGTGAAPPEFSNSIGTPLQEGLSIVHGLLRGAGLRDHVRLICSGKVLTGFSMVRNLALGADLCNSARAMMFALGCIQALQCDTNKCPTGIATQDPERMAGLVVEDKSARVFNFHKRTVHSCLEIIGAIGLDDPQHLRPRHVVRRTGGGVKTFEELFPPTPEGSLLDGTAGPLMQRWWSQGDALLQYKDRRDEKR